MSEFDVIVVGARCAGAATAMLLAQRGLRVLVLDRAKRGSDKLSTLYIHQPGVALLRRWGLLDAVAATGAPPITALNYSVADVNLTAAGPWVGGGNAAYAPRRADLDEILCAGAEVAGAEVRHEVSVHDLIRDNDARVTGVRYRYHGQGHEVTAPLVVGADGIRSVIAEQVGAATYIRHPRLSCCYYGFWSGLALKFHQWESNGHWVGVIPTSNDEQLIACYFRQEQFAEVRADVDSSYRRCLEMTAPPVADTLAQGALSGRLIGMGDQQNYFRRAAGPGWVLIGDAGHHKDSLAARGITDAFIQANLLAEAIDRAGGVSGSAIDLALDKFGQERDDTLLPFYHSTLAVARLELKPDRLETLRDIAASPEKGLRYAAAVAGAITPTQYQEQNHDHEGDAA